MPEGQGLRWWEEEQNAKPVAYRSIPPATPPQLSETEEAASGFLSGEYRDIGEELEAEARRRATTASRATVAIPLNTDLLLRRLRLCTFLVGLPVALSCIVLCGIHAVMIGFSPTLLAASLFPLIEVVLLYSLMARAYRRQTNPVVELTPEGIVAHTPMQDIGLIHWDEIADIRTYTFLYRYVGIVPKDVKALARRLGGRRSSLLCMNEACIFFYKPLRLFTAPINIPQECLPISADDLLAQIAAYRANQHV